MRDHSIRRDVHGNLLRVTGDRPEYVNSLRSRLRMFEARERGEPDMTVRYTAVERGNDHSVVSPSGPSRTVYEEEIGEISYHESEQIVFLNGPGVRMACRPKDGVARLSVEPDVERAMELATGPAFLVALTELLKPRGFYVLHAAGLAREGRALLFPGSRGDGKTTLTVALLRAGYDFLSDDHCFLVAPEGQNGAEPDPGAADSHGAVAGDADETRDVLVAGFPDEVDVTRKTASFFPELEQLFGTPRRADRPKQPLIPEDAYSSEHAGICVPVTVVFPSISQRRESRLEKMGEDEALLELAPNILMTGKETSKAHFDVIGRLVRSRPCYRLHTGRDFEALPALFDELLVGSAP